jgi:hypothetical protein
MRGTWLKHSCCINSHILANLQLVSGSHRKFPLFDKLIIVIIHCLICSVVANSINGGLAAYGVLAGERAYWLHSLVLAAISGYGGGFIAPILICKPSMPFSNDFILFSVILSWYFIFYLHGNKLLNWAPIKMLWSIYLGLFRTYSVTNMVTLANNTLSPSPYYPVPFFGPILCGTLLGSMGMFLPFTKGLSPITKNTPWNIQAAFYTAFFYHTMVYDTGFVGQCMHLIIGTYTKEKVLVIIAITQIMHLELQILLSSDVNFFLPIHQVVYLIFQVNGPILELNYMVGQVKSFVGWPSIARKRLSILVNLSRILLVLTVVIGHIYFTVLPVRIVAYPSRISNSSWLWPSSWMRVNDGMDEHWAHKNPHYKPSKASYEMTITK